MAFAYLRLLGIHKHLKIFFYFLLFSCSVKNLNALAWNKQKGEKSFYYGILIDPGYNNNFPYYVSNLEIVNFNIDIKKAIYLYDYEYGIDDNWTFMSKLELEYLKLKFGVNFTHSDEESLDLSMLEKSQKNIILSQLISYQKRKYLFPDSSFIVKNNYLNSNVEIGVKRNIFHLNNSVLSAFCTLLPSPLIANKLVDDKMSLKFGISYGRNWQFKGLKNNYLEINLFNKTFFRKRKVNEQFLQFTIGARPKENFLVSLGLESQYTIKASSEGYIIKDIVNRLFSSSNLEPSMKKDLDNLFILDKRKNEIKTQLKLGYEFNNNKSLFFDVFYTIKSRSSKKNINFMFSFSKHY